MTYEEKLQEAKRLYESANADQRYVLESLFPELKESEDERVRNFLIGYFDKLVDENSEWGLTKETRSRIIVWLENQGEQKPNDKVEPKFHEGDMIIHKELGGDYIHNPHKIIQVDILDKKYRLEGGLVAHFSEQEDYELVEQKPAWSEEDEAHIESLLKRLEGICKPGAAFISTRFAIGEDEDWLKSLKERYTWKPSDEQIKVCKKVYADLLWAKSFDIGTINSELNRLEEQLKKLK